MHVLLFDIQGRLSDPGSFGIVWYTTTSIGRSRGLLKKVKRFRGKVFSLMTTGRHLGLLVVCIVVYSQDDRNFPCFGYLGHACWNGTRLGCMLC